MFYFIHFKVQWLEEWIIIGGMPRSEGKYVRLVLIFFYFYFLLVLILTKKRMVSELDFEPGIFTLEATLSGRGEGEC